MLSAVIITKNEAQIVAKCLESLKGIADEIVVIDSHSTDNTQDICESFGARFIPADWQGYAATKNYGNGLASYDWILSIDADEALSPELQASIKELKAKGFSNPVYSFHRLTSYCGQWIKHGGWYPDTKARLFDRRKVQWEGNYVHETLNFGGATPALLYGDLLHYSIRSIAQHMNTVNRYSSLAAEEMAARGKKFSVMKLIFSPIATFIQMYFFKAGFLDGRNGFIIAVISAHYRFLKYAKLRNDGK